VAAKECRLERLRKHCRGVTKLAYGSKTFPSTSSSREAPVAERSGSSGAAKRPLRTGLWLPIENEDVSQTEEAQRPFDGSAEPRRGAFGRSA